MYCGKMDDLIEMLFGVVGLRDDGIGYPQVKGNFGGKWSGTV